MGTEVILVCLLASLLAGFVHGAIGMGYGMITMATVTMVAPYNTAAAIVSVALLVLVSHVSWSLRDYVDWKGSIIPCAALLAGKICGIVLMMHLQSVYIRVAFGVFLVVYSTTQLMNIKALKIKGTLLQAVFFCGVGGLFGGVFNVSGPFASIYCQAKYGADPKTYAANMNFYFLPSAVAAVIMHAFYGNFDRTAVIGGAIMAAAVLISSTLGVAVLRRLKAKKMYLLSNIYIITMGIIICIGG